MEEDLVLKVLLKILPVPFFDDELSQELVSKHELNLNFGQIEVDSGEARLDLHLSLKLVFTGEIGSLDSIGILTDLFKS